VPSGKVFISYSHKDEVWKDRLVKHLTVLAKQGRLDIWDDRRIGAGGSLSRRQPSTSFLRRRPTSPAARRSWRGNVQTGQAWAAARAGEDDGAAGLCSAYADAGAYLVDLRQHPRERAGWLEAALAAARRTSDRAAEAAHLGNLGRAYADVGETRRAVEHHEQHLVIARETGDRRGEGQALGNLGLVYADLGETLRAIEHYEQWLAIAREIGDRRGEGAALGNLGIVYRHLGETRQAIEHYEQNLVITREIGDRRGEANASWNLGLVLEKEGQLTRAADLMQACVDYERSIGHPDAEKDADRVAALHARITGGEPFPEGGHA
jgi:tetratricopeptide (TPR) repeat protein